MSTKDSEKFINPTLNKPDLNDLNSDKFQANSNWGNHHIWIWKDFYCHWRVLGNPLAQPLVLIHGFGASSDHWRKNAKDFSESGFCVYAIDLIGFGKSEQPSLNKFKYLDNLFWSEQLTSFLQQIVLKKNFKKAILIGNSLGGLVALTTLVNHPEIVQTIISAPLPDPSLLKKTSQIENILIKSIKSKLITIFFYLLPLEIIIPLISRTKIISYALNLAYYKDISSDKDLKRIVSKPARKKTAAGALRSMCIGMSLRPAELTAPHLLKELSEKIKKPSILIIWGKEDKLIPLFIGKNLQKQYPWIKLLILKNSGHCPHDESPKDFNSAILNWMEINLNANSQT